MNNCPYCGAPIDDLSGRPLPVCPRCGWTRPSAPPPAGPVHSGPAYSAGPPPVFYPPPGYMPPAYSPYPLRPPAPPAFTGVVAIVGFAFAVVAALLCFLSWYNIFLLPAVVLTVIGCVQCYRRRRMRGFSIAGVLIAAAAVAATAGFIVFSQVYAPPGSTPPVATGESKAMAAKGVAAIQAELGADLPLTFHKMLLVDQDGMMLVYMELTAADTEGSRSYRLAVSTDEAMAGMGATKGWWDSDQKIAVFDYTQPRSSGSGTLLDVAEVLALAKNYGYAD